METITAINDRRSIRKYNTAMIPHKAIETIIDAGMRAPSAKNRQPWRFVVVEGNAKDDMLKAMQNGLKRQEEDPVLPQSINYISGARHTLSIMEQAPVTIFVINPLNRMDHFPQDWETRFYEAANLQSVGACIQNMLLAGVDLGYGSLWICDIYFAYEEIAKWLHTGEQIVAAVSFGIPEEKPNARPRNNMADLVEWKR
ncbi:nitroreductase [Anaerotaenia torta]